MDRILIILKKENGPRASSAPALGLNTIIFKHVYWYMQQTQVSVDRTIGPLVLYSYKYLLLIFNNLLKVSLTNCNISRKAAIISISNIIFALVQYQMISFLHCYFWEAHFAIESIFLTLCFLFFGLNC